MWHHHHHPLIPPAAKDNILQRAVRASLHPSRLSNCHRHHRLHVPDRSPSSPVGRVKPPQLLPVGVRGGHPPRATRPGIVAVAGGALATVLLPARVEALPVRRGECRSHPRTPCRGTGPCRQRRRVGRRDASVSSPDAGVRPSFASWAAAAGRATATAAQRRGLELCLCCFVLWCVGGIGMEKRRFYNINS